MVQNNRDMERSRLRPCIVTPRAADGTLRRGYFHRFYAFRAGDKSDPYGRLFAAVEFENGEIALVQASNFRFADVEE